MRCDISTALAGLLLAAASPVAGQAAAAVSPAAAAVSSAAAASTGSASTGSFPSLTGTWSSKSKQVVTGPGFYDPVNEKFIEPSLTGISYSFTDDGHYEEAYYRAVANPTTPSCPKAVMQWQHGTYTVNSTGALLLTPIYVDGRQQTSDPCSYKVSTYERYKQKETFQRYEVQTDTFHNVKRLNLYEFDGTPMQPMYMLYNPPQMLPTMTLNPTASATGAAATTSATSATSSKKRMEKRAAIEKRWAGKKLLHYSEKMNPQWFWYGGLGFVSLGTFMYLYNG